MPKNGPSSPLAAGGIPIHLRTIKFSGVPVQTGGAATRGDTSVGRDFRETGQVLINAVWRYPPLPPGRQRLKAARENGYGANRPFSGQEP